MRTNRLGIAALAVLLLVGCGGGSEDLSDYDAGWSDEDYREMDDMAAEEISADAAEARAWLAAPDHQMFEGDKGTVAELVDRFYAAGAPRVWITGIEDFGGTQVSASIVVEMPSSSADREAVLAIEKDYAATYGESGYEDRGQRYLMLGFD